MAAHIPFVNTKEDCRILKRYYLDSEILRISLENIQSIKDQLPSNIPLWIDPAIDGYEHCLKKEKEQIPNYLKYFKKYEILANQNNIRKPQYKHIKVFVDDVLNHCNKLKPEWITIPQLPIIDNTSRNKINATLAKSAYEWKTKNQFKGKFVLPIIFTHSSQIKGKTRWRPRIDSAIKWYKYADGDILWIVDSSLSDQMGTEMVSEKLSQLIDLHNYARKNFPKGTKIIAGPYWGMNLVLWARNLIDNPTICLGTAYQYHLSGGFRTKGSVKIVIPPLRRCTVINSDLKEWLNDSLDHLDPNEQAFLDLSELCSQYNSLIVKSAARNQITLFYKNWFDKIEQTPLVGRALALYQDLSNAYVIGKQLPILPPSGSFTRKPERVAELFMLKCL